MCASFHLSLNQCTAWMICHIWSNHISILILELLAVSWLVPELHWPSISMGSLFILIDSSFISKGSLGTDCGVSTVYVLSFGFKSTYCLNYFDDIWRRNFFIFLVVPFMPLTTRTITKFHVTFGTGIWFLSCVCPFMFLQTTPQTKTLVTMGAGKWLLTCVGPLMYL